MKINVPSLIFTFENVTFSEYKMTHLACIIFSIGERILWEVTSKYHIQS